MKTRNMRLCLSTLPVVGLFALTAGCQSTSDDQAMEDEAMADMAMIVAADQAATTSITVANVSMTADGFVVVHASNPDGSIIVPDSIGHVAVAAGSHENVVVPLEFPVSAGDVVHVMLHSDDGEIGVYEFKTGATENDLPVVENESPVITQLTVQ